MNSPTADTLYSHTAGRNTRLAPPLRARAAAPGSRCASLRYAESSEHDADACGLLPSRMQMKGKTLAAFGWPLALQLAPRPCQRCQMTASTLADRPALRSNFPGSIAFSAKSVSSARLCCLASSSVARPHRAPSLRHRPVLSHTPTHFA